MNPWWITGFTDGDGTFTITSGSNTTKSGWSFKLLFQLVAANNPSNREMFEIKTYFFGHINISVTDNTIRYAVSYQII